MSKLIHKGIRPEYEIEPVQATRKRKLFDYQLETLPDGSKRYWNKRMLTSGCNTISDSFVKRGELLYCHTCDEYFTDEQFAEVEE